MSFINCCGCINDTQQDRGKDMKKRLKANKPAKKERRERRGSAFEGRDSFRSPNHQRRDIDDSKFISVQTE